MALYNAWKALDPWYANPPIAALARGGPCSAATFKPWPTPLRTIRPTGGPCSTAASVKLDKTLPTPLPTARVAIAVGDNDAAGTVGATNNA